MWYKLFVKIIIQGMYGTDKFKFDIYTHVTREFLDNFLMSLASYT